MGPHAHRGPRRTLAFVLALNALTCLVEFVAGWWTNSLALLSDAGHMLGDVGAIALSLAAATLAARPPAPDKTWGWWRSEILAALANGVTLVVVAALVLVEALRRLGAPPEVPGPAIVAVAAFGLLINLISMAALSAGRRDLNLRGALLHAASDALGSVGAIVAGVLVMTRGWTLADPLASLFIAVLVAVAGVGLLRDTVHVLMEGAPASIRVDRLRDALEGSSGVRAVHDLHVWSLTSRFPAVSAHVVADPALSLAEGQVLLDRLRGMLLAEFEVRHVTLQLETLAAEGCDPCAEPAAGVPPGLKRGA